MTLIRVSDVKPGDGFQIMGVNMIVTNVVRNGTLFDFELENVRPMCNYDVTRVRTSIQLSADMWIEKAP